MATPPAADAGLERRLGLGGAVAIGLSASLGTGAFAGLALAVGLSRSLWPLAIAGAAALALASGLSAGRLAAAHPTSGGTYEQASRLLNPTLGRFAGWLFLLAKIASVAAAAHAIAGGLLAGAELDRTPLRAVLSALIASLAAALVAGGLRRSTAAILLLLALAAASLLGFVATLAPREAPALPAASPAEWRALPEAIALSFVAFAGFGRLATLGEEVRRPARTIPIAIALSVAIGAGLYAAVFATALAATTPGQLLALLERTGSPLVAIAEHGGQRTLAVALVIGGLAAMGGVILNLLLGMSRVVLAMARRGDLPEALGRVAAGSPRRAVAVVGAAGALAAFAGDLGSVWTLSTAAILPYYAVTNLAALREARGAAWGRPIAAIGLAGTVAAAAFLPAWSLAAAAAAGIGGTLLSSRLARRGSG